MNELEKYTADTLVLDALERIERRSGCITVGNYADCPKMGLMLSVSRQHGIWDATVSETVAIAVVYFQIQISPDSEPIESGEEKPPKIRLLLIDDKDNKVWSTSSPIAIRPFVELLRAGYGRNRFEPPLMCVFSRERTSNGGQCLVCDMNIDHLESHK